MKKFVKFLIVIVVVIIILVLLFRFGFGPGGGGAGDSGEHSGNTTEVQTEKEEKEEENVIRISVVGNEYIYENEQISLEELMEELKNTEEGSTIIVKDDEASKNAYEKLLKELDNGAFTYTEE